METSLAVNTPQVFDFQTRPVRVLGTPDAPWFVAADVCAVLGIANARDAVSVLDEDQKGVGVSDTLGGKQQVATIDESGLYTLIFRSNKPEAKTFRRWVTSEVLPAIRKTGSYQPSNYPVRPDSSISPTTSFPFLATTIEVFMTEKPSWTGTVSELLQGATELLQDGEKQDWPSNATWMGRRLRQARPWLQSLGLDFQFCSNRTLKRDLVLYRIQPIPLPAQPLAALPAKARQSALSQLVIEQALEIRELKSLLAQRE